jgi:hypothetical protein
MKARTLFHFILLYRRSCRWMGGKRLRCSVVRHDCSGSYPVMDENRIRFSFLSDIDQAGSNLEVGSEDRSDKEGHGNERANKPSGNHVFLGHGIGRRVVPHCALRATEQTNPQRIRSKIFRMTRPRGGGSARAEVLRYHDRPSDLSCVRRFFPIQTEGHIRLFRMPSDAHVC